MAKFGLGKGLGALIPESEVEVPLENRDGESRPVPTEGLRSIPLGKLVPNPDQPRKTFDEAALEELASSIRTHGIIQPVIVEDSGNGSFLIIAGERRYRAAERAGLREVPVVVRSFSPEKKLEIALIENVQREDLNPVEEAEAYKALMEHASLSQEEVAEKVGKSRPAVANALRLLKLPADVLAAVRGGELSSGHARAILSVVGPADQVTLFRRILDDGLSVRQAEAMASDLNAGKRPAGAKKSEKPVRPLTVELKDMEQKLIGYLGTKVQLKGDEKKGSITIEYFSMDDLERVFDLVTGNKSKDVEGHDESNKLFS